MQLDGKKVINFWPFDSRARKEINKELMNESGLV